ANALPLSGSALDSFPAERGERVPAKRDRGAAVPGGDLRGIGAPGGDLRGIGAPGGDLRGIGAPGLDNDEPLITRPSPPRPPLAVRRSTPEVPRLRAEPSRLAALDLESEPPPVPPPTMQSSA